MDIETIALVIRQGFLYLGVLLAGLSLGSFATMLAYRIPRELPLFGNQMAGSDVNYKYSYCPQCQHRLTTMDLMPIFSWVFSKGRCRHCKASISKRYILIELATLVFCIFAFTRFGETWASLVLILSSPFWMAHIFIDAEHKILPDVLNSTLMLMGLGWIWALAEERLEAIIIAGICILTGLGLAAFMGVLRFVFSKWKGREALGLGDIKFMPVAAVWIIPQQIPLFLILSGVFGVMYGLIHKKIFKEEAFPFGPALILATLILVFIGRDLTFL